MYGTDGRRDKNIEGRVKNEKGLCPLAQKDIEAHLYHEYVLLKFELETDEL